MNQAQKDFLAATDNGPDTEPTDFRLTWIPPEPVRVTMGADEWQRFLRLREDAAKAAEKAERKRRRYMIREHEATRTGR